jgi:hypothetical protein
VDIAYEKQGTDLQDVVDKYQALLEAAEAETERMADKGGSGLRKAEAQLAVATEEAEEIRVMAEELMEEREKHVKQISILEAEMKKRGEEIDGYLPLKANSHAKSEADLAAVIAAREQARNAMRCVDDMEEGVALTPGGCQIGLHGQYWLSSVEPCFHSRGVSDRFTWTILAVIS